MLVRKAIAGSIWFVTCLLCVSILTASVDPLPDPPAVKTERADVKADCSADTQSTPPDLVELASPAVTPLIGWFHWRHVLVTERRDLRISLVHQAADPSPPVA